jgi:butyryl-CoA dehydrogenase
MHFQLTDEQYSFKQLARDFAEREIMPFAKSWDEQHIFPIDTLRKAAKLGFAALYVRQAMGGCGLQRLDSALIFAELAYACPSTAAYLSIHNMVAWMIDTYASDQLRAAWLPQLISMQCLSSYCLTEANAGSDAAALKTQAQRIGDHYIVNGAKAFISGGSTSDLYCCMVRTGAEGARGISALLIDKNTPGLSFGKREQKLGWHSQPTTMVFFDNCKVPITNRLGEEGEGFKIALSGLNGGRINIAACSLGGAQFCLSKAREYLQEREQFKQKLADFQTIQFTIADMLTDLTAARLMVYRAASALDSQDPNAKLYCAMAKRTATDLGFHICDRALQLFGGYGYLEDYPIERYFRDLRVHQILEGSNEIMRMLIGRDVLQTDFNFDVML